MICSSDFLDLQMEDVRLEFLSNLVLFNFGNKDTIFYFKNN